MILVIWIFKLGMVTEQFYYVPPIIFYDWIIILIRCLLYVCCLKVNLHFQWNVIFSTDSSGNYVYSKKNLDLPTLSIVIFLLPKFLIDVLKFYQTSIKTNFTRDPSKLITPIRWWSFCLRIFRDITNNKRNPYNQAITRLK